VKSRVKIIELMKSNPSITKPQLSEEIGITQKAIEKHISNLKKEGAIERVGPDKGGYWRVLEK
jgi:ATP-dependent DNA helicase RecG